jgi:hypothetical protein
MHIFFECIQKISLQFCYLPYPDQQNHKLINHEDEEKNYP